MKKVLSLLFVLAVSYGTAFSSPLSLGVKAGVALSNIGGTDATTLAQKSTDDTLATLKSKAGFVGGAFIGVNLGGPWTLEPEFLFVMKGTKVSATQATSDIKLNYFEIPVLLKLNLLPFKSPVTPFLIAGPSIAFNSSAKITGSGIDQDIKSSVRGADYGLVMGAGLDITKFSIEARYELGLQNPFKAQGGFTPSVHNGTFYILAGYHFI